MKKLFFLFFTIISITASAQDISKGVDGMRKQLAKDMASYDSSKKIADSMMLINYSRYDSVDMARNNRNLDALVSTMKERDQKQKQGMWLRLFFGVALLGVGIFGVLRKRKNKNIQ